MRMQKQIKKSHNLISQNANANNRKLLQIQLMVNSQEVPRATEQSSQPTLHDAPPQLYCITYGQRGQINDIHKMQQEINLLAPAKRQPARREGQKSPFFLANSPASITPTAASKGKQHTTAQNELGPGHYINSDVRVRKNFHLNLQNKWVA